MERTKVKSSSIRSVGYNRKDEQLEIEFVNLSIYLYYNVPDFRFDDLLSASSKGKYFNRYIKNKYRYKKLM